MVGKAETKIYRADGRHFLYLPKNLITDSQFPLKPGQKLVVSITERVLIIQDEEADFENIPVPRELYKEFNRVLDEEKAPYRDPADYVLRHLKEAVERHKEWRETEETQSLQ